MNGFIDLSDILKKIFVEHDSLVEEDIECLKNRKMAIHIDNMCSIILKGSNSNGSIEETIKNTRKTFKSNQIDTITVFNGLNIGVNDDLFRNTLVCSHSFWRLISAKLVHDTSKKTADKEFIDRYTNNFIISSNDAFIHYLTSLYFFRMIMKVYKNNNYDHIVAPQVTNNQLAYMLLEDEVDCICTNPTAFIYDGINQIIYDFDENNRKFRFYDLEKLARELNIKVNILRKVILAIIIYFTIDPNFGKNSKYVQTRLNNNNTLMESYKLEVDKRFKKAIFIIDILGAAFKDNEKPVDVVNTIVKILNIDRSQTNSLYNTLLRTPIINSQGQILIYPQKKALGKYFIIDLMNKDILTYYSLGYIDSELFYLLNNCTNNTLYIKPTRADSLEADFFILYFYIPSLQRALYRILLITHGRNYKLGNQEYKVKFKNNNIIKLDLEERKINLWTLINTKVINKVNFLNCLKHYYQNLEDFYNIKELNIHAELNTNELLIHIYITLLDELGYLNIDQKNISILGELFIKIEHSKFEEEVILFFELLKFGLIKGSKFSHSNLENIPNININGLNESKVDPEVETIDINSHYSKELLDSNQREFYSCLSNFEKMRNQNKSLTLYQIKSCTDKIYESIVYVKQELSSMNLINFKEICNEIDLFLSKKCYYVRILSKMATLANYDYVNHAKLCDFEMYQFTEIVQYMTLALRHSLCSQLLYTFHYSKSKYNLSLLHSTYNKLPFLKYYATECGALTKIIAVKSMLYIFVKEKFNINLQNTFDEISLDQIKSYYNLHFRFEQMLKNTSTFTSIIVEYCKDRPEIFELIYNDLVKAKKILEKYIELIELKL